MGPGPKGNPQGPKKGPQGPKKGSKKECLVALKYTLSSAVEHMQALCDKNLFALRCEFYVVITDVTSHSSHLTSFSFQICYVLAKRKFINYF